jgi:hypothetical protein
MKGKIDNAGRLNIERAGNMATQYCRFSANDEGENYCSDSCPLFMEPVHYKADDPWFIEICQNRCLEFDEFTDERGNQ